MSAYLRYYLAPLLTFAGVVGFWLGGPWVWLGLATFPILLVLDLATYRRDFSRREIRHPRLVEVPMWLHVVLLPALVVAAAIRIHAGGLTTGELIGCAASLAWLGVVPNIPVVHELVHRRGWLPRAAAFLLSLAILDPLRRLGHTRDHHVKIGRDDDSDTARRGETIYTFAVRALVGGTLGGFHAAAERARCAGRSVWSPRGDAVRALVAVVLVLAAIGVLAGAVALAVITGGFLASRVLLESFNYLQHYGLVRVHGTQPAPRHTWSHLTPVVRAAGFELTNHAHHHIDTRVPFYALVPDPEAPQMPSVLVCFLAALVPPVFMRRIAMPRLRHWDRHHATSDERALAAVANAAAGWPAW